MMFDDNNDNIGIGIDIEDISRFQELTIEKDASFLTKLFTEKEPDFLLASVELST
jgi:phosphopantetheinyl transferase (holo-ACP synthase)